MMQNMIMNDILIDTKQSARTSIRTCLSILQPSSTLIVLRRLRRMKHLLDIPTRRRVQSVFLLLTGSLTASAHNQLLATAAEAHGGTNYSERVKHHLAVRDGVTTRLPRRCRRRAR